MTLMLSALALAGMQTMPVRIEPTWEGKACGVRVDGVPMTHAQLAEKMPGWWDAERVMEVRVDKEIPYRCAGDLVRDLRSEGLQVRFVGGSAVIYLYIPTGPCRVTVNGKPVSLARLPGEAHKWKKDAELHFQPDPQAELPCVDRVLQAIKGNSRAKLGFVGNGPAE